MQLEGTAPNTPTASSDIWRLVSSTLEGQSQSPRYDSTGHQTQNSSDDCLGLDDKNTLVLLDEHLQRQSVKGPKSGSNEVQEQTDYDAVRTTTTFLSIIQRLPELRRPNTKEKKPPADSNEKLALKLCNAFATLAVIRHEVVAVGVGFNAKSPLIPDGEVEILLTSLEGDEVRSPNPPANLQPSNGKELSEMDLRCYIDTLEVTSHDHTMEEHVWMLQKMFNTWHTKEEILRRLMKYTIITCFPKMWAHINHPRSILYNNVLESIQIRPGHIFARSLGMSNRQGTAPSEMTVPFLLSPTPAKPAENKEDRHFLDAFLKVFKDEYPKLREQHAKMTQDNSWIGLYTEETCEEFCSSVNIILKGYRGHLSKLVEHRLMLVKTPEKQMDPPTYSVKMLHRLGYMLYILSRGAALRMYLENINPLLFDFHQPPPRGVYLFKPPSGVDPETMLNAKIEVEIADGLEAESTTAPLAWQICLRWIKLLISYFSAASMLVGHMSVPEFPPVSVRLLRNSPGNNTLLFWKDLLENPKYFPQLSAKDYTPARGIDCPNDNIIDTIELAIASNPYRHGSRLQAIQNLWVQVMDVRVITEPDRQKIAHLFEQRFAEIEHSIGIDGCREHAKEVMKELQVWKKGSTPNQMSSSLILSNINSMMEICYVFSQIAEPTFTGTVHCKASLANFIVQSGRNASPSAQISQDSKKYERIISVSKANCPSCHALLHILQPGEKAFLSRDYHKAVFPCSLPVNLNQSTVDEMNSLFGAQLRKELVDFLNDMEPHRRTYFEGSDAISEGSSARPNSPYQYFSDSDIEEDELRSL
ncbi:hypothetical protein GALMADRAFT_247620 [Galerina marginata CBS 339.88]|uniref:Uncharacterized protein n=1 Tax=Galerina marginata (strain CBS 339.88) TaxID=685588 RepID=A0A067T8R0_GALM3|nr:hypothetical protein GALMADRAFT_247620 [Galerina marginata CBS 339.88]